MENVLLGFLITSDHQLYRVTPLKTPFGLLIPLLQSQSHVTTITRNYFYAVSPSHSLQSYTFVTTVTYNTLLHVNIPFLTSTHIHASNKDSVHTLKLAPRSYSANSLLKTPLENWLVGLLLTNWLCTADGFQDNSSERTMPKTVANRVRCVANRCGATKYKHSSLLLARLTSALFGFLRHGTVETRFLHGVTRHSILIMKIIDSKITNLRSPEQEKVILLCRHSILMSMHGCASCYRPNS
jgi:hypothetical protein